MSLLDALLRPSDHAKLGSLYGSSSPTSPTSPAVPQTPPPVEAKPDADAEDPIHPRNARPNPPACRASVTPNSRGPLIAPEVRLKIEAVEAEARRLGWPAELLWNPGFWDSPRGLAAVLDPEDEIVEVTPDDISILRTKRDLLRFPRHTA